MPAGPSRSTPRRPWCLAPSTPWCFLRRAVVSPLTLSPHPPAHSPRLLACGWDSSIAPTFTTSPPPPGSSPPHNLSRSSLRLCPRPHPARHPARHRPLPHPAHRRPLPHPAHHPPTHHPAHHPPAHPPAHHPQPTADVLLAAGQHRRPDDGRCDIRCGLCGFGHHPGLHVRGAQRLRLHALRVQLHRPAVRLRADQCPHVRCCAARPRPQHARSLPLPPLVLPLAGLLNY